MRKKSRVHRSRKNLASLLPFWLGKGREGFERKGGLNFGRVTKEGPPGGGGDRLKGLLSSSSGRYRGESFPPEGTGRGDIAWKPRKGVFFLRRPCLSPSGRKKIIPEQGGKNDEKKVFAV